MHARPVVGLQLRSAKRTSFFSSTLPLADISTAVATCGSLPMTDVLSPDQGRDPGGSK